MKIKKMLTMLAAVMLFVCMFGLTVSAEDGGMYYAPAYDEETGIIAGAPEIGDWIPYDAVFSGKNLQGGTAIEVLLYDTKEGLEGNPDGYGYYDCNDYVCDDEERTLEFWCTDGDPTGGWIVTNVYYNEYWDVIAIVGYFVNEPSFIEVEVSIDFSKIGYFRIGKDLPVTADGFYTYESERVGESCDGGFLLKVTSEHFDKGYISDDATVEVGAWIPEWLINDNYVVSASDEFCYNFDVHAYSGSFTSSWDDVDISEQIHVMTEEVSLYEAYAYSYMVRGDVAEVTLYLGTAEEILEKAGINDDVQYTGWKKIGNLWYFFDSNGNLVKNQWKKDSKGWCYLGEGGFMLTNQRVEDSKGTCYVGADGYIVYNKWVEITEYYETCWYYFGSDGYMVTNKWVKDSKGWCYLSDWGGMATEEWVKDSKGYVYVDESGYMVTNQWVDSWEGLYYVNGSGYRVTNQWKKYEGNWVYLGKDGQVLTEQWVKDSVGWCYVDEDGFMVYDQWVEDSVGWCYVGKNGYMVTNKWFHDGYEWLYIGPKGYVLTNQWMKDSVGWCYLDSDGYMMRDSWVQDSVGWCYVDGSGYMVTNDWVEDCGDTFYMNASGYATVGWKVIDGNWYYFDADGVMARDQWIGNDYVNEDGVWVA